VKAANPITYISGDEPRFLIVHGTDDPLVPSIRARFWQKRCVLRGSTRLPCDRGSRPWHRGRSSIPRR
jgi:hypothetical protein